KLLLNLFQPPFQKVLPLVKNLEAMASVAGVLSPIFGIASAVVQLSMRNVESEELLFMKEQFHEVRNQLDVYFAIKENIKNQFRKYMQILDSAPEYQERQKEEFLTHFQVTKGDQNLHTLYDGFVGNSAVFAKPILITAVEYAQGNRHLVEALCASLKDLFGIGLIALMGYTSLTGLDLEAAMKEWKERLVEAEMVRRIDQCDQEFRV
uniref:Rapunzel n=1 Tax=Callorhinchus milii TaxID=7868 RepID=A0A4W3GZ96_CALMI